MPQSVAMPASRKQQKSRPLYIALPEPGLSMKQDAEWCVVRVNGAWEQIRFHDYEEVYAVPGLYERLFYDILQCTSPATVRGLLEEELRRTGYTPENLRVLDLGAGNGMVGEELTAMGVESIVGVDNIEAAAEAAGRDRPGIYEDYVVADMANLSAQQRVHLGSQEFNCLTCVAALGFGDIPPKAFAEAYNLIGPGGWIAFNIKDDFLDGNDASGFSTLIKAMSNNDILSVRTRERYRHRVATDGRPLYYVAVVGIKKRDVQGEMLS